MKLSNYIKVLCVALIIYSCNSEKKKTTETSKVTKQKKVKTPLEKSMQNGRLVYNDFCITCHLASGKGVANVFPPLANSDYLKNNQEASIKGIKYGQNGEIVVNGKTYNGAMAALGLDDNEVADVMNYINNSWGNNYGKLITEEEVAKIEK